LISRERRRLLHPDGGTEPSADDLLIPPRSGPSCPRRLSISALTCSPPR
jgi:hypothetical protein